MYRINKLKLFFCSQYILSIKNVNLSYLSKFLIIFFITINSQYSFSAEEKFEVVTPEKIETDFNVKNNKTKTLAKISKNIKNKNSSTDKIVSENINLENKDEAVQLEKNIYDLSAEDVAGINSLMMAVGNNDISGVKFYSKAGSALINQKNFGGATALHIASREGYFEIAKILIESGADINSVDNEGWTPLMRANLNGNYEIVQLLISKGASSGGLNNSGESVIMHATLSNCDKCLNLMLEKLNFSKNLGNKVLKEQITDSFIISRNRENPLIQGLLEAYLDRLIKISPIINHNLEKDQELKKITTINQNSDQEKIIKQLIAKDQEQEDKANQNKIQAEIMANFIDQKNKKNHSNRNITNAEVENKIKLSYQLENENNKLKKDTNSLNKLSSNINTIDLSTIENSSEANKKFIINIKKNENLLPSKTDLPKKYVLTKFLNPNEFDNKRNDSSKQSDQNYNKKVKKIISKKINEIKKSTDINQVSIEDNKNINRQAINEPPAELEKTILIDSKSNSSEQVLNKSKQNKNNSSTEKKAIQESLFEDKNIDIEGNLIEKKPKYVVGAIKE